MGPPSTSPSIRSLVDLARMRADDEYLVFEDERWTFGSVAEHIDRVGAMLVERYGVEPATVWGSP